MLVKYVLARFEPVFGYNNRYAYKKTCKCVINIMHSTDVFSYKKLVIIKLLMFPSQCGDALPKAA